MASSKAKTVAAYLAELPVDRRQAISQVRNVIRKNLPTGYEEGMLFGMISYYVPLSRFPNTYNGQPLMIAALASQKNYMSVYLMGVYGSTPQAKWFHREWAKTGKKLDMGKSCVRFNRLDDLPLPLIGKVIARVSVAAYLKLYEQSRSKMKK